LLLLLVLATQRRTFGVLAQTPATLPPIAIVGVTIVDEAGRRPLPHSTILINGERTAAIFPAGSRSLSAGTTTMDPAGRFVIPGLIDTHVHLATDPSGDDNRQRTEVAWQPRSSAGGGRHSRRGALDAGHHEDHRSASVGVGSSRNRCDRYQAVHGARLDAGSADHGRGIPAADARLGARGAQSGDAARRRRCFEPTLFVESAIRLISRSQRPSPGVRSHAGVILTAGTDSLVGADDVLPNILAELEWKERALDGAGAAPLVVGPRRPSLLRFLSATPEPGIRPPLT
jgi:hypothetical protein